MFTVTKNLSAVALTAALTTPLAACGSNDPDEVVKAEQGAVESRPSPVAQIQSLTGVQTAVMLDAQFLQALSGLNLVPAAVGDAVIRNGSASFPITGGELTYFDPDSGVRPFVRGGINHEGSGLRLTGKGKQVELTDFVVDPDESLLSGMVTVDGKLFSRRAPLFFLDGTTLQPLRINEQQGTAVLAGTTVSLTKTGADALNMVYGTRALNEFFKVGIAEITVALPR